MYASKAVDRLMRSIVQTSNAVQANKWLAGARLIYDVVKSKRAALGLSTKPFSGWAGLDLDVQQIVAGQKFSKLLLANFEIFLHDIHACIDHYH